MPLLPFHLKTVKGLKQILHSCPQFSLSMRMQGFSPQHLSQATGKSDISHPCLFIPVLVANPRSRFIQILLYNSMSVSNLGHMRFKRQLTPLEEDIVKEVNLQYTVELEDWWFAQGQFGYYNCNLIFQVCQEITASKIDFHDNQRTTIIKEICHISFPNLISLHLSSNNIESLEHLSFLKAHNLQRLYLNGNNITQVKSLRKCNFLKLITLSLSDNKIVDLSFISQCSFVNTIKTLDLQQVDAQIKMENISSVLKLKSNGLSEICWGFKRQAVHQIFRRVLERRLPYQQ